jgi:diguanylate cyclase (GGDEF)-like protein
LLYADLDNLKNINDTWGHQKGDLTLIEASQILKKNYRESDIIARIGGDEFVVFPVATYGDKVENIINRLQKAVESYNVHSNRGYKLSLSAGISFYDPKQPCSIDGLLSQADKSMYKWKKNNQTR